MKRKIIIIDITAMIKVTLHMSPQRGTGTFTISPASCSTLLSFREQILTNPLHHLTGEIKIECRLGVGNFEKDQSIHECTSLLSNSEFMEELAELKRLRCSLWEGE